MKKRKIGVVVGSRANYSSIRSVLRGIKDSKKLELLLFAGASALLDKYGRVITMIEKDGFKITEQFYMLVEGEVPETMAMSAGLGLMKLPGLFLNHKPDIVITVGDRFETISTAIAAAYMNIHLAHTMGGEISGTIDESIRHAVTKFAHIHFPANKVAAGRITKMGEDPKNVFVTGCPRIDTVKELIDNKQGFDEEQVWLKYKGVGGRFDIQKEKFLLVSQHPVTTEYGLNRKHIRETLAALQSFKMPTIMIWPNADAGSDEISKEIRTFREKNKPAWLHIFKNLPMEVYIRLMDVCACLIGNTSSAIREGSFIGVPAVNIGTRQMKRLRGKNVIDVDYDSKEIINGIKKQLKHGKYKREPLYGDGSAGTKIIKILEDINLKSVQIQKRFVC